MTRNHVLSEVLDLWKIVTGQLIEVVPTGTAGIGRAASDAVVSALLATTNAENHATRPALLLHVLQTGVFRRELLLKLLDGVLLCDISPPLVAFLFIARTPFPGLAAVPACVGTALLIAAGETGSSVVGAGLSFRPMVFIGLISYSLYLWHWPLIVFWNRAHVLGDDAVIQLRTKLTLFVASLVVGALSWLLVETPFRKGRFKLGRTALFLMNGLAAAVILAVGIAMLATHGLPSRYSPQSIQIMSYLSYRPDAEWQKHVCFLVPQDSPTDFNPATCLREAPGRPQALLLGDSVAAALYPGLVQVFPELNISQATSANCWPFVTEFAGLQAEYARNCKSVTNYIYGSYLPAHHPKCVLLAGSWRLLNLDELGHTIKWLKGHGFDPIVFGPVPEYDTALPRLIALALRSDHPSRVVAAHHFDQARILDRRMAEEARDVWRVRYISAFDVLCAPHMQPVGSFALSDPDGCPLLVAPGVPLDFDFHHLTVEGSVLYAQEMRLKHLLP